MFLKHYNIDPSFFLGENNKKIEKTSELFYNFSKLKGNVVKKYLLELVKIMTDRGY
jgi:hypothetical protein